MTIGRKMAPPAGRWRSGPPMECPERCRDSGSRGAATGAAVRPVTTPTGAQPPDFVGRRSSNRTPLLMATCSRRVVSLDIEIYRTPRVCAN